MPATTIPDLKTQLPQLRADIIRMIEAAGSGHPGGSLSVIDILAALYSGHLRHDPKNPNWADRDRLILSKGHACPALYAVMAYTGYFPKSELIKLRKLGSPLQGHPDRKRLPGVEFSTGSLGQGLSVGLGMALAAKLDKKDYKTIVILGDGEMQEGQCWEAIMAAPKFNCDNLIAIVDHNNGQIDGPVNQVMPIEPLKAKFESFHWDTMSIDGHDLKAIDKALTWAKKPEGKPKVILAGTVKGKYVSFMEHNIAWHGNAPKKEDADKAVAEILGGNRA
jgi:transketolase